MSTICCLGEMRKTLFVLLVATAGMLTASGVSIAEEASVSTVTEATPPAESQTAPVPDPATSPAATQDPNPAPNQNSASESSVPAAPAQQRSSIWLWLPISVTVGIVTVVGVWAFVRWKSGVKGRDGMCKNGSYGGEKAFKDFIELFFGPMVEDGRLADHEFAPLSAAYFALGVEHGIDLDSRNAESQARLHEISLGMQDKVNLLFGSGSPAILSSGHESRAELAQRLVDAWKRMTVPPGIQRITLADREALLDWIKKTLEVWDQPSELEELVAHATTQTKEYLEKHCEKQQPTDGDKNRVRRYFSQSEKLLASRYNPEDTMVSSSSGPAPSAIAPTIVASEAACDALPPPAAISAPPTVAQSVPSATVSPSGDAMPPSAGSEPITSDGSTAPPVVIAAEVAPLPPPPKVVRIDLTDRLQHVGADVRGHVRARRRQLTEQAAAIVAGVDRLFGDFSRPTESPLALSRYRSLGTGHVAVVANEGNLGPVPFWFLGDIHGDLLGLDAAIEYIDSICPDATVVFLGDLFDDEGFGLEVLLRVFQLIVERPGRIGYVVGNHDVSLKCAVGNPSTFSSSVSPCDFADFLNQHRMDSVVDSVGQRAVQFFAAAPRAIFMPDGLIATHGGVPLVSRLADLKVPEDLERPECLQDFVWTRAHERARKKIPNPTSKTSEFGFEDFARFCEHASNVLGIRAERMVRGHDHFEAGHSTYDRWSGKQCVTVNTMSRRLPRDPFGTFHRTPCVARWIPGAPIEIHQLVIPATVVEGFYGKPGDSDVPVADA